MQQVKKNSVRIFVEKIHKTRCLEGSGVPVLYIGRTFPKGIQTFLHGDYCIYVFYMALRTFFLIPLLLQSV
jgi:hypothetical protein